MKQIVPITSLSQITVRALQSIYRIAVVEPGNSTEKSYTLLNSIYGLTREEIDSLDAKYCSTLIEPLIEVATKPMAVCLKRHIAVNGKRYHVEYDPDKLTQTSKLALFRYFPKSEKQLNENSHCLVARVVSPMKKIFGVWVKQKHEEGNVDKYMEDMLDAKIPEVLSIIDYYRLLSMGGSPMKTIAENEQIIVKWCKQNGLSVDDALQIVNSSQKILHAIKELK